MGNGFDDMRMAPIPADVDPNLMDPEKFDDDDGDDSRVLESRQVRGRRVRNRMGDDLGVIEETMIDLPTGRVAYAVLSFGGFLGIGTKLFAIPWQALKWDAADREFILDVDKHMLQSAPGFDRDHWPNMADPAFTTLIYGYYGYQSYLDEEDTAR
jgi:PRC-barrel domain